MRDCREASPFNGQTLKGRGDIERAVEAGADDFVSKPVDKTVLLNRVVNLLKLQDRQD